ncbi:hypothetical protein WICPIJ_008745 [Wickerhamomyces pijperi]|uniref:Uncharacterized protein n=1 Tax=Wickerhamomyces pijperi TaxID=599730 RepID=A0A9P8PXE8_WICPI|nr:hypothetical protein WICPIJ_008745 [Wickerhamomyces pijperi]
MRFQSTKASAPKFLRFPVRLAAKEQSIDQLLMGDAPKDTCRICQIANAKPVKTGKHNSMHIFQKSVKFVKQFLNGKKHSTEKRDETFVTNTTFTPQITAVINKETSHRQEQVSKPKTKSTGKPASSKQVDPEKKKYSKMIKYYMDKDRIYQEQKKLKLGDKYVEPEPTATVEFPDVLSMKEFALSLVERDEKRKIKAARRAMKEAEEMRRAHKREVQERKRQIQDLLDIKKQISSLDPQFEEASVFPATAPTSTTSEEPVEQLPYETKEELLRRQQAAKMRGTNRAFMARAAYGRSASKRPTFNGTAASFRAYGY